MQRIAPFCYYYQELSGLHALELAVVELGVEAVCSKQLVVAAPVSYTHLDVYKRQGQEPSRDHKFSILENLVLHRDFTSSMRLHFRTDLVGACLPQTLLMVRT